jgi:hypothetical protein
MAAYRNEDQQGFMEGALASGTSNLQGSDSALIALRAPSPNAVRSFALATVSGLYSDQTLQNKARALRGLIAGADPERWSSNRCKDRDRASDDERTSDDDRAR